MSFIDLTQLNPLQDVDNTQTNNQNQEYGLLRALESSTASCPVISRKLKAHLSTVQNQTFEIPALKEHTAVTTSVESFTVPANFSESTKITATKITHFTGFHFIPSYFQDNMISESEYFTQKNLECGKALAAAKETAIAAVLESQKTQTMFGADGQIVKGYTFNANTDTLEVNQAAQEGNFFGNLSALLRSNYGKSPLLVASKLGLNTVYNARHASGRDQAVNLQNEFNSQIPHWTSDGIGNPQAGEVGTGFLIASGSIGQVVNFTYDYIRGTEGANTKWAVSAQPMPFLGEQVGIMHQLKQEDGSSLTGTYKNSIPTLREEYGIVHNYFLLSTFKQDIANRPSDVIKLSLLNS